ncbi:MAG: hypothetical protein IT279_07370 [Ignavibacteriaceae bacterium]|nr:hypothetical protein [Ignavibacteriaceae bacterium]
MKSTKTARSSAREMPNITSDAKLLAPSELESLQEKTRKAAKVLRKYHPTVKFLHLTD